METASTSRSLLKLTNLPPPGAAFRSMISKRDFEDFQHHGTITMNLRHGHLETSSSTRGPQNSPEPRNLLKLTNLPTPGAAFRRREFEETFPLMLLVGDSTITMAPTSAKWQYSNGVECRESSSVEPRQEDGSSSVIFSQS